MIERYKALPLKTKIFVITLAISILSIIVFAILYFTKSITLGAFCMASLGALTLISLVNLQNGSIEDDRSVFIFNLIVTIIVFAGFVAVIVLSRIEPNFITNVN